CPKCAPLSSSCFIVTTAMAAYPLSLLVDAGIGDSCPGVHGRRTRERDQPTALCAGRAKSIRMNGPPDQSTSHRPEVINGVVRASWGDPGRGGRGLFTISRVIHTRRTHSSLRGAGRARWWYALVDHNSAGMAVVAGGAARPRRGRGCGRFRLAVVTTP